MSSIFSKEIICIGCNEPSEQTLFVSINTRVPNAVEKILTDKINYFICPYCNSNYHIPVSLLFSNIQKAYMVVYRPHFTNENASISTIEEAIRLANSKDYVAWSNFKNEIRKLEATHLSSYKR